MQDSYKVRFPFCFQSLRQSVCCLSAEKSFVLSYISVFRCLWLAVSTPPTCLTFNYFGNGSIAFHIVFTCYEIRCQLRKTCCSLSCQSPFRLPHASASSKMSFNTMIGSLNLTDFSDALRSSVALLSFLCHKPLVSFGSPLLQFGFHTREWLHIRVAVVVRHTGSSFL